MQRQLDFNREQHFHANTGALKQHFRLDKELRRSLADSLIESGLNAAHAARVAQWDPYDQKSSAEWFDAEYMFGNSKGFDVVIGNPPYISHDKIKSDLKPLLKETYQSYKPFADLYCYFLELSLHQLVRSGVLALITSNSYLRTDYGQGIRACLRRNSSLLQVLNIEDSQVFDNAIVNVAITFAQKTVTPEEKPCLVVNGPLFFK